MVFGVWGGLGRGGESVCGLDGVGVLCWVGVRGEEHGEWGCIDEVVLETDMYSCFGTSQVWFSCVVVWESVDRTR